MSEAFLQIIPTLRIFSLDKAREFYVDYLGFKIDWEHRFDANAPVYMQVSRGSLVFHLSEHHGDACPGAKVFIWMTGVREYHREVTSKNYKYLRPGLNETFYGSLELAVTDPFGNRISFNEEMPHKPQAEKN